MFKNLVKSIMVASILLVSINCFAITISDLHGLYVLYSVRKDYNDGTFSQVTFTSGEIYGYGYFTLNNRFRIRVKYQDLGFNINKDRLGNFTLNNNKITMVLDSSGTTEVSTLSLSGNQLTVETDFRNDPDKGYVLTMVLTKQSNILNVATLSFNTGWNLLTVSNFIKPISEFSEISDKINTIWQWNTSTGSWQIWSPDDNIMNLISQYKIETIKEVIAGEGFWLSAKSSGSFHVDNFFNFKPEMIFQYVKGWNLVGVLQDIAPINLPDSSNISTVWKWDSSTGAWQIWSPDDNIMNLISQYKITTISTIKKLEGFWVNYK